MMSYAAALRGVDPIDANLASPLSGLFCPNNRCNETNYIINPFDNILLSIFSVTNLSCFLLLEGNWSGRAENQAYEGEFPTIEQ